MKKKEKPTQKQKEFAVSPFKALKGAAVQLRDQPAAPAPPPKKPAKSQREMDDELLFLDAVADVRRLTPAPPASPQGKVQPPSRAARDEEERRVFMQAVESLKIDVRFRDEIAEEESPQRKVAVNRLRQLRRGAIRVDLELDLHGLTRDEAIENLERFVKGAYNRGQKAVLVITGKGNNSPGEPVLRSIVAVWLREVGKTMVSEFILAPKDMGGSGAIVVFLKEKKVPEQTEAKES